MPFELKNDGGSLQLILSGRLGVQQATPLWTVVQPALLAGNPIRLLAGDLEEMDTSIVQILCKLGQAQDQRPARMQIAQVSDGFIRSLKRAGLEKFFVQATSTSRVEPPPPSVPLLAEGQSALSPDAVLTISEAPTEDETIPETLSADGAESLPETAAPTPATKKRSNAKSSTSGSRLSA